MPSQVYMHGDFWEVRPGATPSPGQSPQTHPQLWRRVAIPAEAAPYLAQAAYSFLLPGDGQSDKRRMEERIARDRLDESIIRTHRHLSHPDTMQVLSR